MNISDIIRVQTGFKQTSRDSKIGKKIAEKVLDYNVIQQLLGGKPKGKKGKNKSEQTAVNTTQANPAYNVSLSGIRPPDWSKILTKSEPIMSDEEFEEAIRELALKKAENGTLDDYDNEYWALQRAYVSAVSPDRKAAYATTDFTKNPVVYGNVPNYFGGNELMSWAPDGWVIVPTTAEREKMSRFGEIYMETLKQYEAEHGLFPPENGGEKPAWWKPSKPAEPIKNYL